MDVQQQGDRGSGGFPVTGGRGGLLLPEGPPPQRTLRLLLGGTDGRQEVPAEGTRRHLRPGQGPL